MKQDYEIIELHELGKLEAMFGHSHQLVLDFETSGLDTTDPHFHIVGIGLYDPKQDLAAYVHVHSFELPFGRTPGLQAEETAILADFFQAHQFLVFNLRFECRVVLAVFGVDIDVLDTMPMQSVLGLRGGLKASAERDLEVPPWADGYSDWARLVEVFIKILKPTRTGNVRKETEFLAEHPFNELVEWMESRELKTQREERLLTYARSFVAFIEEYYSQPVESGGFFCQFSEFLLEALETPHQLQYSRCPMNVVIPYCVLDLRNTWKLAQLYEARIRELKLEKVYNLYMRQALLGLELEISGIAWNEAKAAELETIYEGIAVKNLKELLLTPRMRVLKPLDARQLEDIEQTDDVDFLKGFFNPNSNHIDTRSLFSDLVLTPALKFALLLQELYSISLGKLSAEAEMPSEYPVLWKHYTAVQNCEDKWQAIQDLAARSSSIFSECAVHSPEQRLLLKYAHYRLESLASDTIAQLYSACVIQAGLDIDDQSTWFEEFWNIYRLKVFKKVQKSLTAYIRGSVGRQSTRLVRKSNVWSRAWKWSSQYQPAAAPHEQYILQSSFSVNRAATKRWRSGMHLIPWGSELVDLRQSRYSDGLRVHFDYSQMEVRVLAAMAGDAALLDELATGADIHRFVASQIWSKKPEDVTDAERRYSKLAVFSILYGKSELGFAKDFMRGNLAAAKKIFSDFYSSFPQVRAFIENCHQSAVETGQVKTLFGDPIDVDMPAQVLSLPDSVKQQVVREVFSRQYYITGNRDYDQELKVKAASALRNSQNYPIQSTASTLAGEGFYRIANRLKHLELRPDCFTHDSGDFDCRCEHVPDILPVIEVEAVNHIWQQYGVPVAVEVEIGLTGAHMVVLEDLRYCGRQLQARFDGLLESVQQLQAFLRTHGVRCEYAEEEEYQTTRSTSELFITRRGFTLDIGRVFTRKKGSLLLDFGS